MSFLIPFFVRQNMEIPVKLEQADHQRQSIFLDIAP